MDETRQDDFNIAEDEQFRFTPKGIAAYWLLTLEMIENLYDPKLEIFWTMFEKGMTKNGYVENPEGDDEQ